MSLEKEIVHGRPRDRKEVLEKALGIRLDDPTRAQLQRIADERQWSLGKVARHLIDAALVRPATVAEPPAHYGEPTARGLLLVEEGVGAGQGRLPIIPESDRPYFFREDWLRARGWSPEKPDRLVCVKLGPTSIAESMYPTIQEESVLVVDREPSREKIAARSIWLVEVPGEGLAVKRVTVDDGVVILESDNPDPEYAPRVIHLTERRTIEKIARGRVLWYATEVA